MLTRCKKLIVVILLLVYTGQAVAAWLMPCLVAEVMQSPEVNPVSENDAATPAAGAHHEQQAMPRLHDHHAHTAEPPPAAQHAGMTPDADGASQKPTSPSFPYHPDKCCAANGCSLNGCFMHGANASGTVMTAFTRPEAFFFVTPRKLSASAFFHYRPPNFA